VEKTSVYLGDRERRRLAHLADQEGVSQAEIIRRAITAYEPKPPDREFKLFGAHRDAARARTR
jgi:predicted transcriptional regulator